MFFKIDSKGGVMKNIILLIGVILLNNLITNAQWSNDPTINTPVCLTEGDQINPLIIGDGKNGAIICWMNALNLQIYVQRVDSSGYIAWNSQGVRVSPLATFNNNHKIISDGHEGAIIVWNSDNNGELNIYAQRIDTFGNLLWDTIGVEICVRPLPQIDPIIISDGSGGAFIGWEDRLSGMGVCGIYAQRINSDGEVLWATDGVPVCTSPFQDPIQFRPKIVTDNNGEIIILWDDTRNIDKQIYGQKLDSDGNRQWINTGLQISQGTGEDRLQGIFNAGQNEFIIAWTNGPSAFTETNIYIQKIDDSGNKKWSSSGVPICVSAGNQYYCSMISDNNAGAILVWEDRRTSEADIYAQRIDSIGFIKWQVNGIPVCNKTDYQLQPRIVTNEDDGAIVCWQEMDNNNSNIYAQRIDKDGLLKWGTEGSPVSISTAAHIGMINDNRGGAIISWDDRRNGDNNHDIFIQRIDGNGNLGITSIDDKNFAVSSYLLFQNYPNPFNPITKIIWQSAVGSWQTLKVYDVLGREIKTLVDEYRTAGKYEIEFDASSLTSGVYFYQIKAGDFISTKKMILLK